jgi:uncharacterized membrane protein
MREPVIAPWFFPLLIGLALAFAAYHAVLVATPGGLMRIALSRLDKGGVNRFTHGPMATDRSRLIVRPSPDLAYSSCPFDLSAGPVTVGVAPVPAPYWSLSVFDGRTDVAFVRNNRDTGGKPIRIVLARPGQTAPAGVEVVRLGSDRGVALVRILVEGRDRFSAIDAARRASRCAPV